VLIARQIHRDTAAQSIDHNIKASPVGKNLLFPKHQQTKVVVMIAQLDVFNVQPQGEGERYKAAPCMHYTADYRIT